MFVVVLWFRVGYGDRYSSPSLSCSSAVVAVCSRVSERVQCRFRSAAQYHRGGKEGSEEYNDSKSVGRAHKSIQCKAI